MLHNLFLLALSSTMFTASVKDCSSGSSLFTLNSASVTPDIPVAGDQVQLSIDYTVPEGLTVTDGTSEYAVTYNFMPFAPTIEPLCANVPCPLLAGSYKNDSVSTWPSGLSGTIVTQMKWYDLDRDLLLCVGISWKTLSNHTDIARRMKYRPRPLRRRV